MAHKLYGTNFVIMNMTNIVVNGSKLHGRRHNDWLHMTRFFLVHVHIVEEYTCLQILPTLMDQMVEGDVV
jgi:hypothetical protein